MGSNDKGAEMNEQAIKDLMARIITEGVERFGSVDAFGAALAAYNAERAAR